MLLSKAARLLPILSNPSFCRGLFPQHTSSLCHSGFNLKDKSAMAPPHPEDELVTALAPPEDEFVFVYGTLKLGEPNHYWFEDTEHGLAAFVARGTTMQEFPLVIATEYNIPMLLDKPGTHWTFLKLCRTSPLCGTGKRVKGEVWRVDTEKLVHLDVLEEHPKFYRRERRGVEVEGREVTCWLYAMVEFKQELLELPHLEEYSSGVAAKYDAKYLAGKEDEELHANIKGTKS